MAESSKTSAYDLSRLNEGQLSAVFLRHGGDVSVLQDLNQELKRRNNDAANDLHMKVARALRTVTEGCGTKPLSRPAQPLDPAYVWLQAFWAARLLGGPDGRSLHRYKMTDDEYAQAKEVLRRLAESGRLIQPNQRAAALFVAYCADWYRRESTTTFLRWEDSTQELGASVPDAVKRDMAKFGLEFWRRPLRRSTHAREFLLTIALEGGFPVRILADGARGWLKDYLRAVMRQAIAWSASGLDEIREIAENERGRMRRGYQHEDFLALCSELACKLLEFRREAEAAGDGGIRNTALLDARHPGWRDELPIYVPEADEGLATELLTGLLDDKMTGLATDGVEARRYLVRRDGVWHPALQLRADGEIAPAKLLGFPTTSRARATPLGELANHLAGEVALFEPPVGEQRRWRVRPCIRTGKLLVGFPLTAPVVATLTSPDRMPTAWGWPRGDALRSELLVFTTDDGATPKEPLLRFLRSGSTSSSAKSLYALIPRDWLVEPSCDNAVVTVEDVTSLERKLVHISATVYFRAGANETIRFRVEPDADERDQALTLQHWNPSGFALTDTAWELVAGPVCPVLSEGTKRRPPAVGELYVRRPGGRWTALAGPLRDTGPIELSWRDPVANIQIERRQLVIMPDDATIVGRMTNGTRGEIRLDGLSGWTASVRASGCAVESTQPDLLSFHFVGRPLYRLPLTLRPPVGPAFDVVVSLMGRDAVIALADGAVVAPCQQIDVGALRGAVALSPTRSVLRLSAKGEKSASVQTVVDGELPIGVLRSAISETFATLTDQDEMVEVEFLGDTRPPIRLSRYRNWVQLRKDQTVRWPDLSLEGPVRPVARMILAPRHEHALEETADDGAWRIPDHCSGPCLVYLRDGVDVLSRPIHIEQPGTPQAHFGGLTSALVVTDFTERQRAIAEALGERWARE